jgi:hypothetical protein
MHHGRHAVTEHWIEIIPVGTVLFDQPNLCLTSREKPVASSPRIALSISSVDRRPKDLANCGPGIGA